MLGRAAVQPHHGALELAFDHQAQHRVDPGDRLFDGGLLVATRHVQHEIGDILLQAKRPRMTDPDPGPPEVGMGQAGLDVFQAIVARSASAQLQSGLAGRQIELIVRDQDLIGQDPVKQCGGHHGLTGPVHQGRRFQQDQIMVIDRRARQVGGKLALGLQARPDPGCEPVDQPESGVVPGALVTGSDVAQADDHPDPGDGSFVDHRQSRGAARPVVGAGCLGPRSRTRLQTVTSSFPRQPCRRPAWPP